MKVKGRSLRSLIMLTKDQRLKAALEPQLEIRNDRGRAFKVTEAESSLACGFLSEQNKSKSGLREEGITSST